MRANGVGQAQTRPAINLVKVDVSPDSVACHRESGTGGRGNGSSELRPRRLRVAVVTDDHALRRDL